jgi:hypothetical protein
MIASYASSERHVCQGPARRPSARCVRSPSLRRAAQSAQRDPEHDRRRHERVEPLAGPLVQHLHRHEGQRWRAPWRGWRIEVGLPSLPPLGRRLRWARFYRRCDLPPRRDSSFRASTSATVRRPASSASTSLRSKSSSSGVDGRLTSETDAAAESFGTRVSAEFAADESSVCNVCRRRARHFNSRWGRKIPKGIKRLSSTPSVC